MNYEVALHVILLDLSFLPSWRSKLPSSFIYKIDLDWASGIQQSTHSTHCFYLV